jgi:hypothetical protein
MFTLEIIFFIGYFTYFYESQLFIEILLKLLVICY